MKVFVGGTVVKMTDGVDVRISRLVGVGEKFAVYEVSGYSDKMVSSVQLPDPDDTNGKELKPIWYYKLSDDNKVVVEKMWAMPIPPRTGGFENRVIVYGPAYRCCPDETDIGSVTPGDRLYMFEENVEKAKEIFEKHFDERYDYYNKKADEYARLRMAIHEA